MRITRPSSCRWLWLPNATFVFVYKNNLAGDHVPASPFAWR